MARYSRIRLCIIGLILVAVLAAAALPVFAGTTSYSGALTNTDPVFRRVTTPSFNTPGCASLQPNPNFYYDVQPFYVDVSGAYVLDMLPSSSFDTYNILYVNTFDPANPFANCVTASDDESGSTRGKITATLTADVQYYHVVSSFGSLATGTYDVSMSGPGNIILGLAAGSAAARPPFTDGRINNRDQWATFAVYCPNENIEVYAIDATGRGQLAFTTTPEEIEAVGVPADANVVIEEGRGVRLFRLTSGEFQIVGPQDAEGKTYNVMFSSCGLSGMIRTFMYP